MTLVFYVSGHGYGHAGRTARVLEQLSAMRPDWRLLVRTQAPASLFPPGVDVSSSKFESSVVETSDSLTIDIPATRAALDRFAPAADSIVAAEAAFVRECGARLVVADVPYLAGEIAAAVDVRSAAIGNFTWHWIYEDYLPSGSGMLARMRSAYSKIDVMLRLPFGQPAGWEMFRQVEDVPLVARACVSRPRLDPRPTVFLAGRGNVEREVLQHAARTCEDFCFAVLGSGEQAACGENIRSIELGPERTFGDVLAASDIVLAKLGYSLAADCISFRKRLVYPPRQGFREEAVLRAEVGRHIPALPLDGDDYRCGEWAQTLRAVCELPPVTPCAPVDGAVICAQRLVRECE